jgi:GntR family transcriptional repressor for pyruvate dehydrogenase complex
MTFAEGVTMTAHRPRTTSLADSVVEELRRMILDGEVQPGEFLPTREELAQQFGVGQSTIHEAIRVLNAIGLVQSRAGKGTWVRHDAAAGLISPEAIKSRLSDLNTQMIYEVRTVLEVSLAEFAAQRAAAEDIERIWAALQATEEAVARDDQKAYVQADLDFHLAVTRAAHNDLLEQFYQLSLRLLAEVIAQLAGLPGSKEDAILTQRAIAHAIEQHDPDKARQAAIDHLAQVGHHLLDLQPFNP